MDLGEWSDNAPPGSEEVFKEWINNLRKLGDHGKAVQLNFVEEKRLPKLLMREFLEALVKKYQNIKAAKANANPDVALLAIEKAVNSSEKFRGALRLSKAATFVDNIVHFISLKKIKRFNYSIKAIDVRNPPPCVYFNRGLGMRRDGTKAVLYIWVIFPYAGKSFNGMNATAIRDVLGMSDVKANDYLYKVDIVSAARDKLRIPTVLDAKGNPAWFPVPPNSPWGITRNLNTDAEEFPELLRESLPSKDLAPRGRLICERDGKASWTSPPSQNYLKRRMKKFFGKI